GESALFVKIDPEGRVYFFQAPDWVLYGNIQPDGSLLLAPELVEKAKEERIHLRVQFFRLNSPEQLRFCREETLLDSGENLVPGTSQVECQLLSKTDTEQMAKQVAQEFNKTEESREPHQVVVFTQTISSRETPSPSSVFLQRSDSEVPSKRIWEYLENTQIIIEQNILNWSNNYEE
ncbi:MAG: hypothetical protein KDD35_12455, partial [Bdellovibrionales bacterium]|nr:hypothetical protein [Bdellovibrionales bacterium]